MQAKKILILRFSSIGDVVLTTPVIRCAKAQLKGIEIHFVVKESFKGSLIHNPNIDKLHCFKRDVSEVYDVLRSEKFDVVIDLQKSRQSFRLKLKLGVRAYTLDKINLQKFAAVNFKWLNSLPNKHIVERYFEAIAPLGVKNDYWGLDYFISESENVDTRIFFPAADSSQKFIALVAGGSYYTKRIPINKLAEICGAARLPVVIMGGKEDAEIGDALQKQFTNVISTCGKFSINQSASLIRQAEWVITSDTGLMHIASAFNKKIISVWGNTIPQFGMGPYLPASESMVLENKTLKCRPCSKLGYRKCPIGHFKCMNDLDYNFVKDLT